MVEKNGKIEKSDKMKLVGFNIPEELDTMIDAVLMADMHDSKSDLARKAIQHYIETKIPESTRDAAEKIVKERAKNLKELQKEDEK